MSVGINFTQTQNGRRSPVSCCRINAILVQNHGYIYTPKMVDALLYAAVKVLQRYTGSKTYVYMYIHTYIHV